MAKFWPQGTTLTVNAQTIGGIDSISGPSGTRGEIDLSDFDSGGDAEFTAGIRDQGTVEITGKFNPEDAGQQELRSQFDSAGVPVACLITLPVTAGTGPWTIGFSAFVSALSQELPLDGAGTFSATLRVSGAVVVDNVP